MTLTDLDLDLWVEASLYHDTELAPAPIRHVAEEREEIEYLARIGRLPQQ
jgi:hypothetical protein